ncbi:ADM_HP2_G0006210.mRNA.1.CDS.1 [Saccharomyces cerevisiae]|nr:ADM_HP2_G0006210.mRNA.1.CDS.1 [Saccharomyces cerevisiae]CAI6405360.1 ADM_HP2_G0006210.mRNA.1.CDS.1 [Saccharomyces cerevisiae]CAI6412266.1 ADM_HP1_G0006620.mRNA.1.CDS.1 [Saccharomyces cerevisiae]
MHKPLRWLITIAFYVSNVILIGYSLSSHGSISEFYLHSVVLIECFSLLGVVTSDCLTPSLSYISSNIFHISDRVSGMTLLALGNALPDITSTYQSMKSGVTSLAIGELFGGIFFLLTVVIGLMGCVATIQFQHDKSIETYTEESFDQNLSYDRSHYILDVGIFTFMLLVSGTFLADGRLYFWECIVMVLTYCCCAVYLIKSYKYPCEINDALEREVEIKKTVLANNHITVPNRFTLTTTSDITSTDDGIRYVRPLGDTQIDEDNAINLDPTRLPSKSLDNISRFNQGIPERRDLIRRRIRGYLRSHYHGWVRMTLQDLLNIWEKQNLFNNTVKSLSLPSDDTHLFTKASLDEEGRPLIRKRMNSLQPKDFYKYLSLRNGENSNSLDTAISAPQNEYQTYYNEPTSLFLTVPQKKTSKKSLSCDRIPNLVRSNNIILNDEATRTQESTNALNSISDVIDNSLLQYERDDIILDRTLSLCSTKSRTAWHSFQLYNYLTDVSLEIGFFEFLSLLVTTPLSIILYLSIPSEISQTDHDLPLSYLQNIQLIASPIILNQLITNNFSFWLLILSLVIAILLYFKTRTIPNKFNSDIIFTVAFLLSLACLSKAVHIIVVTLTHWINVFNISETILGLTIFTWGNSIGDLVSNITFVKIGVLEIAIGACFGSPLLYFLFGVGFDGIMIMLGDKTGKIVSGRDSNILMHHIDFKVDKNLINTGVGILIAFLIFTVLIPSNDWKIDKKISIALLTLYIVVTCISVFLEVHQV